MAFAIAGRTKQPELPGDTEGRENAPPPPSEEDINKGEEGGGADGGADATDPGKKK